MLFLVLSLGCCIFVLWSFNSIEISYTQSMGINSTLTHTHTKQFSIARKTTMTRLSLLCIMASKATNLHLHFRLKSAFYNSFSKWNFFFIIYYYYCCGSQWWRWFEASLLHNCTPIHSILFHKCKQKRTKTLSLAYKSKLLIAFTFFIRSL